MATVLAIGAMVGGTALSTYSALDEGRQAAEQGKIQQQQFEAEAKATEMTGADEARKQREEGRRLLASQVAAISASGGLLNGSNLIVVAESARNIELDALTLERNTQLQAGVLRQQGALARYQGQLARYQSRIRAFSNVLGTAGSFGTNYLLYRGAGTTPAYNPSKYTGYHQG